MHELARYLLENLYLDFQGDVSVEKVRELLREDDSKESRALARSGDGRRGRRSRRGRATARRRGPLVRLGAAAGLVSGLAACGGDAIEARPDTPAPACEGCVVVDNPVLQGEGVLLGDGGERAQRSGDEWRYDRFEVLLEQVVGAVAKGSEAYAWLRAWPAAEGLVAPAAGATGVLSWEAHGARVGYGEVRYGAVKASADASKSDLDARTALVLDPEVILVPVRGVRTVPDYEGAPVAHATQEFTREALEVVLDDAWKGEVVRSSSGGSLSSVTGVWERRTQGAPGERRGGYLGFPSQTLPDDVFRECKIQFRLVEFIEVSIPKHLWEMVQSNDPTAPVCGTASHFAVASIENEAPPVDYPSIFGVHRLLHPSCPELDQYDILERAKEKAAFIVTQNLRVETLLLAHELGHVLGLNDDLGCTSTDGHLMCGLASLMRRRIADGSCAGIRTRAARYANAYYGTSFVE